MKSTKKFLIFYFIILFISNFPNTEEIEICRIGGKQYICGKCEDNSGKIDNIDVQYYTSCATLKEPEGYSCLCIQVTTSGIWNEQFYGYKQTYDKEYLTYQTSPESHLWI